MNIRKLFLLAPLVLGIFCSTDATAQKPSQTILASADSIYMYVDMTGAKIIQHPVKRGQTLYALSKHYGISLAEIHALNPNLADGIPVEIGQRINISVPNAAIRRNPPKPEHKKSWANLYYVVQPSDNLYHVAKRHFAGMPLDSIKSRNNMKTDELKVGQLLRVGWFTTEPIDSKYRGNKSPETESAVEHSSPTAKKPALAPVKVAPLKMKAQGLAQWSAKSSDKGTEMTCLHKNAIKDSVVKVTFPQSKKTIHAKVLGGLPKGTDSSVEVILSPAAAKSLGIKDPKVLVEMEYLK